MNPIDYCQRCGWPIWYGKWRRYCTALCRQLAENGC